MQVIYDWVIHTCRVGSGFELNKLGESNDWCYTDTKVILGLVSAACPVTKIQTYNNPTLNINRRWNFVFKMTWSLHSHGTGSKRTVKSRAILIEADAYVCAFRFKHLPAISPLQPSQLYDMGRHWNRVSKKKKDVNRIDHTITVKHSLRKVLDGNILR